MKKNAKNTQEIVNEITRKEAIQKIGNYSKYAALTSMATFLILQPLQAQATSSVPEDPGF